MIVLIVFVYMVCGMVFFGSTVETVMVENLSHLPFRRHTIDSKTLRLMIMAALVGLLWPVIWINAIWENGWPTWDVRRDEENR